MNLIKKILSLVLFVSLFSNCEKVNQIPEISGQGWYIIINGEKVYLNVKENAWILLVPDTTFRRKADDLKLRGISQEITSRLYDKVIFRLEDRNKLNIILNEIPGFVYISPIFELEGENYKHSTGELLLRWKGELSDKEIQDILQKYNLRLIEGERVRWLDDLELYEILPPYEYLSIEIANNLYENNFVEEIQPNFSNILKRSSFSGRY